MCLQNVVRIFMDGTTIKVYKYAYKYHTMSLQSGLGELVIQLAVQPTLVWLTGLSKILACLVH